MKNYTFKQKNDYEKIFGNQDNLKTIGNRKISKNKKNNYKNKKNNLKQILTRKIVNMKGGSFKNMNGGGFLSNLPHKEVKNDPFISNDTRNVNKKQREIKNTKKSVKTKPLVSNENKKTYDIIDDELKDDKEYEKRLQDHENRDRSNRERYYKKSNPDKSNQDKSNNDKTNYNKNKDYSQKNYSQKNYSQKNIFDKGTVSYGDDYPVSIPINNYDYPYYGQLPFPYDQIPIKAPIQKIYNIGLAKPNVAHQTISRVYEDVLPGQPYDLTFSTIDERNQLIQFMRNLILKQNDGENKNVTGGKNSLQSYIKLIQLGPYSKGKNPYRELPTGFMLYSAAYPIRYDSVKGNIDIRKKSTGLNLRIYQLSLAASMANKINSKINNYNFEVWRDIAYYQYIKKNIIDKKQSPNFTNMILYLIDTESMINWNELTTLIYKEKPEIELNKIIKMKKLVNNDHNIKPGSDLNNTKIWTKSQINGLDQYKMNDAISKHKKVNYNETYYFKADPGADTVQVLLKSGDVYFSYDNVNDNWIKQSDITSDIVSKQWTQCPSLKDCSVKKDMSIDSGKSLIALTEAPTFKFFTWCSPQYVGQGSIRRMIATGHHDEKVWRSILFQLVYTFAVLQKHGIYFKNLSLENNFYIKDIFTNIENKGHWIYTVNNIDFYIPNYGHVLVFNSSYDDLKPDEIADVNQNNKKDNYKVYITEMFNEGNRDLSKDVYIQFQNIFTRNTFTEGQRKGASQITAKILDLIQKINNDETTKNISELLIKFFPEFTNNKVGTLLMESEQKKINLLVPPKFKEGKLCVVRERFNEYKWALYLKPDNDQQQIKKIILTKNEEGQYIEKSVFNHSIINYPESELVEPLSYKNLKLDNSNLIEEYKF